MPTGDSLAYTGGSTHRPLPLATDQTTRPTHTPKPKPTGLDFDALLRRCSVCGQKKPGRLSPEGACTQCQHLAIGTLDPVTKTSGDTAYVEHSAEQVDAKFGDPARPTNGPDPEDPTRDLDGWRIVKIPGFSMGKQWMAVTPGCPTGAHPTRDCGCRAVATIAEARTYIAFQLDDGNVTGLAADLLELDATDPDVRTARRRYDAAVTRVTQPEDHIQAPREETPAPSEGVGVAAGRQEPTPVPQPTTPQVKAKIRQTGPDDITITLHGPGLAHRQTDIASLLTNLLAGLHQAPDTVPEPTRPAQGRDQREGGFGFPFRVPPSRAKTSTTFPIEQALELHRTGYSIPTIAKTISQAQSTVRRQLRAAGIDIPDGRSGNGGRNKIEDPDTLVAQVRDLYASGLTMAQVGEQIGASEKVVARIMRTHNIERRPHAFTKEGAPRRDNAGALRDRVTNLGLTSYEIKHWALSVGLVDAIHRGVPKAELVDAYLAAHPTHQEEGTTA